MTCQLQKSHRLKRNYGIIINSYRNQGEWLWSVPAKCEKGLKIIRIKMRYNIVLIACLTLNLDIFIF